MTVTRAIHHEFHIIFTTVFQFIKNNGDDNRTTNHPLPTQTQHNPLTLHAHTKYKMLYTTNLKFKEIDSKLIGTAL